jgi:hypothetical protein
MKARAYRRHLKSHVIRRGDGEVEPSVSLANYWFTVINYAVFDNALPRPQFVIKQMNKYDGWCRADENEVVIEISTNMRSRRNFIATVAHEMVHLSQWVTRKNMGHGPDYKEWKKFFEENYGLIL